MPSNGVFERLFCIKMSNTCVINAVSAKTCVLVLLRGWVFGLSCTLFFALGAVVLQPFCPAGGDFAVSKQFPRGQPGGGC